MKKNNINPVFDFFKIIFGISVMFVAFYLLAKCSKDKISEDRSQLDEMRVTHSDKGLVVEEAGLLIIKTEYLYDETDL
ncbi:hypothetical protein [Dysgonomonas macrotermitis]|uniref:Uncharacterized protein n=1 Tax=Dysgonomonas macrotermitis TaxID=1346286 RepID=A0A1M4SDJ2_9BACT|nr:hypothetical protein [Dysgonomonas macrotermitis]SHE30279.1 hypothetical protein SAMN05444362_10131 [Dysgonomonas macrotermitis]